MPMLHAKKDLLLLPSLAKFKLCIRNYISIIVCYYIEWAGRSCCFKAWEYQAINTSGAVYIVLDKRSPSIVLNVKRMLITCLTQFRLERCEFPKSLANLCKYTKVDGIVELKSMYNIIMYAASTTSD